MAPRFDVVQGWFEQPKDLKRYVLKPQLPDTWVFEQFPLLISDSVWGRPYPEMC